MNVFDILGPVMIGPSSSHTAGAAKIGRIAGIILGERPVQTDIYLHGSFAATYRGHGSDRALVGGLLGFAIDDERLRNALDIAAQEGFSVSFHREHLGDVHPNTVRISVRGVSGKTVDLVASSVGGGDIRVIKLSGFAVDFSGESATLIIPHRDRPGTVAAVTAILAEEGVNIAQMKVSREFPGEDAMMIIETDQTCGERCVAEILKIASVFAVTQVEPLSMDRS